MSGEQLTMLETDHGLGLTAKQLKFALAYLADPENGTAAAIAAGCPKAGAHVAASRMLRLPKVQAFLAQKRDKMLKPLEVSTERILRERARLAFFDVRKLLGQDGKPLPVHELDDDTAAAIAGLDVEALFEGSGKERFQSGEVVKYKLADKNASLTALEKIHGMYKDEDKGQGALNIVINLA